MEQRRIALVLGGGGMKGFAHIGVLRALEEANVQPTCYAGTSIGALLSAAYVGGMSLDEMERRALSLRKRDLFRINHVGMLLDRMRSPSIYLDEPLRALCASAIPGVTFDQLPVPLLVNTVDVERGIQVVWGLPGLRDVRVDDAVYASCALPGFFPPGRVDGRLCIDGGTIDNMPVAVAAQNADAVIAVDVGSSDLSHNTDATAQGFAATYMRAATVMMHALQIAPLSEWSGPPMFLIRPRLGHVGW
ncbi:MAG TPA: patatin-like phospholipase family protein, partial [Gemmatimonadaceae bacterium]|nr:patatin-like phospholipase family protein [Gemmatimonadaceae bacterium]